MPAMQRKRSFSPAAATVEVGHWLPIAAVLVNGDFVTLNRCLRFLSQVDVETFRNG